MKKNFLVVLIFLIYCSLAWPQDGVLPSWMRRSQKQNTVELPTVEKQKANTPPALSVSVTNNDVATNGEVLITIEKSNSSASIASLMVNGFEMGGFNEARKVIKRFLPSGKSDLKVEVTDEFGQKFAQTLSFNRPNVPVPIDTLSESTLKPELQKLKAIQTTKKVVALVIGNSNYPISPLTNPQNDANDIANSLESLGYKVRRIINGDRRTMLKAFSLFREDAEKADVGILYYAGHGVQVGGVNYILPVDFNLDNGMASVQFDGVAVNQVLENFFPTETKIAFLDACRDNPLSRSISKTRGGNASGLAAMDVVSGTLISFSTKDGSVAQDGIGRNSPYTKALLSHLNDPVDVSLMLRRVRQMVIDETGGKQVPWDYGSLVGDELVIGGALNKKK